MARSKTVYVCQSCGTESSKWIGRCNACGEWNTYVEQIIQKSTGRTSGFETTGSSRPEKLTDITSGHITRIDSLNGEFNRVLGGGIVPGSLILVGGEPGIGKSTLALQVAVHINLTTLYVSGEESPGQIKMRAERMQKSSYTLMILSETSLQSILNHIQHIHPDMVIIDSIQTLYSEDLESTPGSVSQVRECAARLLKVAKETGIPVILIGHITKEGNLAGPKVLEHIVDTVLQFEGDTHHVYRILRAHKNRFGSTSELGVFEMHKSGLLEITNPSELLINQQPADLSGSAIAANIEGVRPLMIEVQALVSTAVYGTPQRTSTGFDLRRLSMLLAVLEKRANFKLASKDVFINIAGGIRVDDPAIDLAVVAAILSSSVDIPVENICCFAGEVGLSGEIRPVNRIEQRLVEAEKLGFKKLFISSFNRKSIDHRKNQIEIVEIDRIQQLAKNLFG